MSQREACFFVDGVPRAQGSVVPFMTKGMRYPKVRPDNRHMKTWRRDIAWAAKAKWEGEPSTEAIFIQLIFACRRPVALPKKASLTHTKKPDIDKLARAVLDALTGIVYVDDSQVHTLVAHKHLAPKHGQPCLCVIVREDGDDTDHL